MSNFFNATPHQINIIQGAMKNEKIRKYQGGSVVASIEPSGKLYNSCINMLEIDSLESIPIFEQEFTGVELPESKEYNYIVSQLYVAGIRATQPDAISQYNLYTVGDPVFDESGSAVIGCRGLVKAK